jgi:hypothetical protein
MGPTTHAPIRCASRRASARGQAMIETMLLTWIMLIFVAAAYQLFLVNRQITSSLTQVHAKMMRGAFIHNCYDDNIECTNDDGRLRSAVIWNTTNVPQVRVPRLNMFKSRLPEDMQIFSNSPRNGTPDPYCDPQDPACKRTRAAAGTYQDIWSIFPDIADTLSDAGSYRYLLESIDDALIYELRGYVEDFMDAVDQVFWFLPDDWKDRIKDAFRDLLGELFT